MKKIKEYFNEVINELFNKVTWPTWAELQSSGIIVLVTSFIIAIIIFIIDYTLGINSINNNEVMWKGILGFIYKTFS